MHCFRFMGAGVNGDPGQVAHKHVEGSYLFLKGNATIQSRKMVDNSVYQGVGKMVSLYQIQSIGCVIRLPVVSLNINLSILSLTKCALDSLDHQIFDILKI